MRGYVSHVAGRTATVILMAPHSGRVIINDAKKVNVIKNDVIELHGPRTLTYWQPNWEVVDHLDSIPFEDDSSAYQPPRSGSLSRPPMQKPSRSERFRSAPDHRVGIENPPPTPEEIREWAKSLGGK